MIQFIPNKKVMTKFSKLNQKGILVFDLSTT